MKNWKISKIQIQGFKAFQSVLFDFATNSLITLEGPNGYGKTTVFDAIELLLTGGISRVSKLFERVMQKKQTNYVDNLYWNKKNSEEMLFIKVEFVNLATDEKRSFARFATPADLSNESNNRADKFEIFKLCALDSFESKDFSKTVESDYFDSIFGENFCKNYKMLNYLHQGESAFIFSSTTAERKSALEELIDARKTVDSISICNKAERRITTLLNASSEKGELERLRQTIKQLESTPEAGEIMEFQALGTKLPQVDWDLQDPFPVLDPERYLQILDNIKTLIEASKKRDEIRTIIKNRSIDKFINEKDDLITLALSIGKHIDTYDSLKVQSNKLLELTQVSHGLGKGAEKLTSTDVEFAISKNISFDLKILEMIATRDDLSRRASDANVSLTIVLKSRNDLLAAFDEIKKEHYSSCPLCGHDWGTYEKFIEAAENTSALLKNELDVLGLQLTSVIGEIETVVAPIRLKLGEDLQLLERTFNRKLFEKLERHKESFENLKKLNVRLVEQGIDYEDDFSLDEAVLIARKVALVEKIRALKVKEGEEPPVSWESKILQAFKNFDDFFEVTTDQFLAKLNYVEYVYKDKQNTTLQKAKHDLNNLQALRKARSSVKERIAELKETLIRIEKNYSAKTIADIELIFHIYSGRLIQNYQRGLGLFIERGDGSKLQFSTAERSEHDATLSMSSGQLSALSLAFFLSLNRVYSKASFVLIDDPAQSLDDINVASLTDLLRCELKDRQLIMSSHEDDIAAYMRYRFQRAALSQKSFHMQNHATSGN